MNLRWSFLYLFFCACAAHAAQAQSLSCDKDELCLQNLTARELLQIAETRMNSGDVKTARDILSALNLAGEEEQQRRFLLGQIEQASGNYDAAIFHFRVILAQNPKLTRVRLELARTLFLDKDDDAADYHFRLALADQPPLEVREKVMGFRRAMRNRRSWRASFDIGIAPDSNINGATSDAGFAQRNITTTAPQSGLGLMQQGSFTWNAIKRGNVALQIGGFDRVALYRAKDYNDILIGGDIGMEVKTSIGRISVAATGLHRWYGGRPYVVAPGVRVNYEKNLSSKWSLFTQAAFRNMDYALNDDLDGNVYLLGAQATRALNNVSYLTITANITRDAARAAGNANWDGRFGLGYGRELPWGLTTYVYVEGDYAAYDGEQAFFGTTRQDFRLRGQVSLLKRNWSAFGFAPKLGYNFYQTRSNIGFYSYTRHQTEVSLTRVF
jgi:outer membrane protein